MKRGILLLLLAASVSFANAQSLKEALYGGKLKNEPGTVIRKGDDLSTKIDTSTRKAPEEVVKTKPAATAGEPMVAKPGNPAEAVPVAMEAAPSIDSSAATPEAPKTAAAATKDNNMLLKSFVDSVVSTVKTEVLSSKKIKSGSYYVLLSYAIGADGQLAVNDVFLSPESGFLQEQLKQRLSMDTPRLNPVLSSNGTPRKISKKYNFTIVKE